MSSVIERIEHCKSLLRTTDDAPLCLTNIGNQCRYCELCGCTSITIKYRYYDSADPLDFILCSVCAIVVLADLKCTLSFDELCCRVRRSQEQIHVTSGRLHMFVCSSCGSYGLSKKYYLSASFIICQSCKVYRDDDLFVYIWFTLSTMAHRDVVLTIVLMLYDHCTPPNWQEYYAIPY